MHLCCPLDCGLCEKDMASSESWLLKKTSLSSVSAVDLTTASARSGASHGELAGIVRIVIRHCRSAGWCVPYICL